MTKYTKRTLSKALVQDFYLGKKTQLLKIFVSFKGLRTGHNFKNQKVKSKDFRAERTSGNVSKLTSILKLLTEVLSLMGFLNASWKIESFKNQINRTEREKHEKTCANTLTESQKRSCLKSGNLSDNRAATLVHQRQYSSGFHIFQLQHPDYAKESKINLTQTYNTDTALKSLWTCFQKWQTPKVFIHS